MKSSTNLKRRAKTPLSQRQLSALKQRKSDRSQPKIKRSFKDYSVSPVKTKSARHLNGLKQEVLDLKRQEKSLMNRLKLLEMESQTMTEKFDKTKKDLQGRRSKLENDRKQIIDLFANFIINGNIIFKPHATSRPKSRKSMSFKKRKVSEKVEKDYQYVGESHSNQTTRDTESGVLRGIQPKLISHQYLLNSSNLKLLVRELEDA